jgi:hypothetical protein
MKKVRVLFVAVSLLAGMAYSNIITFDDVNAHDGYVKLQNGYDGLNWDNFYVVNGNTMEPNCGYKHGIVSGENVAFNAYGNIASLSDALFTFNGANLTGAWNDGLSIDVNGYKNGSLLYSKTVIVNTDAPKWCDFNFIGIDNLSFNSYGGTPHPNLIGVGTHFAMDNFTFNATSVPEPGTLSMLLIGLLSFGSFALKRKNK